MTDIKATGRRMLALAGLAFALALSPAHAAAQTIDSDLSASGQSAWTDPYPDPEGGAAQPAAGVPAADPVTENGTPLADPAPEPAAVPDPSAAASQAASAPGAASEGTTYKQDDLIGAAEGVFGKGAEGLARMIQTWLEKQGEPNAYIVGREGGGAVVVGVRYGSGTLFHKVEGQRPVYWTGPSVGFDLGANAGGTFVLVYNLYNTEDIYKRFPAVEGQAYVVGGFHASYLRRGNTVLIPIRMGAGLRLGVNAGYMKIRKTQKWIPF